MFCCHDFGKSSSFTLAVYYLSLQDAAASSFKSLMHEEFNVDEILSHLLSIAVHATGFSAPFFFHHLTFQMPRSPTKNQRNGHFPNSKIPLSHSVSTSEHACLTPQILPPIPATQRPRPPATSVHPVLSRLPRRGHRPTPDVSKATDLFSNPPGWPEWVCKGSDSQGLSS